MRCQTPEIEKLKKKKKRYTHRHAEPYSKIGHHQKITAGDGNAASANAKQQEQTYHPTHSFLPMQTHHQ